MQQRTKVNILKIFDALRASGSMHIRGIARVTGMNPITVSTLVTRLEYFFIIDQREVVPGFSTKIVSLKNPEVTVNDVERYLEVKKRIKGNANELPRVSEKNSRPLKGN
jgi:hypothetical protein